MPIRGTPKFTELRLAQLTVDTTKQTLELSATAALVDPRSPGAAAAWHKCSGNVWSSETMNALRELMEHMETDMARVVMDDVEGREDASPQRRATTPMGLGEHLSGDNTPQM